MAILKRESTAFVSNRCVTEIVAKSDYKELIGATDEIGLENTSVVIPTLKITTNTSIGDTWLDDVDVQNFGVNQIEIPAYIVKAKWRYNVLEEVNLEKNIPGLGMRNLQSALVNEAVGLRLRQLVLYGNEAGEGLVSNCTEANISGTGWKKDSGELLSELLQHISELMSSSYSMGTSIKICMPVALESYLNTSIINTSKYLTSGSTHSIGGALQKVLEEAFKIPVSIIIDNTLYEDGNQQKPQMLVVIPTLKAKENSSDIFSTEFTLGLNDANSYMAISPLDEKQNVEVDGYSSGYAYLRASAGMNLRKECALLIKGSGFTF